MDKQLAIKLANPRWSITNGLLTKADAHALIDLLPEEKRVEYTEVLQKDKYAPNRLYALCMATIWHLSMQAAIRNGVEPPTKPNGEQYLMLTTHPFAVVDFAEGDEQGKEVLEQYFFPFRPPQAAMSVAGIHRLDAECIMIAYADKHSERNGYYITLAWLPVVVERAIGYIPLLAGN